MFTEVFLPKTIFNVPFKRRIKENIYNRDYSLRGAYATVFLFGGFDKFEIQISKPVPDRFRNPKQTLISSKFCNGTQISADKHR